MSSALHSVNDHENLRKFYLSGTKLTVLLMLPVSILAFFFGPAFLELWLGGEFSLRAGWILRALVLGTFVNSWTAFGNSMAQGAGRVRPQAFFYGAAVLAAAASWPFVIPRYGGLGAAWAYAAAQCVYSLVFLGWCNRDLAGVRQAEMARVLAPVLALSVPLVLVSFLLRNALKAWVPLGVFAALVSAGFLLACYRFALTEEERSRVDQALRSVKRQRPEATSR